MARLGEPRLATTFILVTKTVVVTGVAGFIGSRVAARMAHEDLSVVGVDDLSSGKVANIPSNIEFVEGDLAVQGTIAKLPKQCAAVCCTWRANRLAR